MRRRRTRRPLPPNFRICSFPLSLSSSVYVGEREAGIVWFSGKGGGREETEKRRKRRRRTTLCCVNSSFSLLPFFPFLGRSTNILPGEEGESNPNPTNQPGRQCRLPRLGRAQEDVSLFCVCQRRRKMLHFQFLSKWNCEDVHMQCVDSVAPSHFRVGDSHRENHHYCHRRRRLHFSYPFTISISFHFQVKRGAGWGNLL